MRIIKCNIHNIIIGLQYIDIVKITTLFYKIKFTKQIKNIRKTSTLISQFNSFLPINRKLMSNVRVRFDYSTASKYKFLVLYPGLKSGWRAGALPLSFSLKTKAFLSCDHFKWFEQDQTFKTNYLCCKRKIVFKWGVNSRL